MKRAFLLTVLSVFTLFNQNIVAQNLQHVLTSIEWKNYNTSYSEWINNELEEFNYNEIRQVTDATYKTWQISANKYLSKSRIQTSYLNLKPSTKTYAQYQPTLQNWADSLSRQYLYNDKGWRTSTQINIFSKLSNQWIPLNKEEYDYDNFGNITELYFYSWNNNSAQWIPIERNLMTYDEFNRNITYHGWLWDELLDEWVYYDKEEYIYENNGKTIYYTYWQWNEYLNSWIYVFKDYSTYYNNDLNWGYLSYTWSTTLATWVDFTKEVHDLNSAGKVTRYAEYEWNTVTKKWDYYDKEEYVYDNFNNVTQFIDYNKTPTYNQWIESLKEVYVYNTSINADALIIPFDEPLINNVYFNSQLLSINSYNWDILKSAWQPASLGLLNYQEEYITSFAAIKNKNQISIHPNPVQNFLFINSTAEINNATISIYSLMGQKIFERMLNNLPGSIHLSTLLPGQYIIKITSIKSSPLTQQLLKIK